VSPALLSRVAPAEAKAHTRPNLVLLR
jgi:hypothetical protein